MRKGRRQEAEENTSTGEKLVKDGERWGRTRGREVSKRWGELAYKMCFAKIVVDPDCRYLSKLPLT